MSRGITTNRSFGTLGALVALAFFLICTPSGTVAQLSGTYTIGSGGTTATFTAAVSALTGSGVSGAVTFNVLNGTYNEQVSIPSITGASVTNTITFQSNSGIRSDVTLYFTPTSSNNYVVQLYGADYVTFRQMTVSSGSCMTYAIAFHIAGDADNNRILDNQITGYSNASSAASQTLVYSSAASVDNTEIDGNTTGGRGRGSHRDQLGAALRHPVNNNTFADLATLLSPENQSAARSTNSGTGANTSSAFTIATPALFRRTSSQSPPRTASTLLATAERACPRPAATSPTT